MASEKQRRLRVRIGAPAKAKGKAEGNAKGEGRRAKRKAKIERRHDSSCDVLHWLVRWERNKYVRGEMIVFETARLRLRHMTGDDVDALSAVLGDPVAMKYYPSAFQRNDVKRWIEWCTKSYADNGYGLYAMVLKKTNTVIGDCGHARQEVDGKTEIEIGYHVRREHWGQGYATEAARGAAAYGFETLWAKRLISLIRPENAASRRVAEKVGMKIEKEILRKSLAHLVYSVDAAEYSERKDADVRRNK